MTTFASNSAMKTSPPLFTMFPGSSNLKSGFPTWADNKEEDVHPIPPVRPVRHVQHASQWAERSTVIAPGYVVATSTTATVSREWSQYSTSSEVSRSSSQQFQTIRTQTVSAAQPTLTSAQYLDDLKLPTEQLDLAAQLGKGCIGRKGSLGGRRPPTIRSRRSSQGNLLQQVDMEHERPSTEQMEQITPVASSTNGSIHSETTVKLATSTGKAPPPRPPPPVFNRSSDCPALASESPVPTKSATDWNTVSRSETPPTLPSTSPPPLSDDGLVDFAFASSNDDAASTSKSVMTDVVEIHDKESVGEDGEVVRRRTIITLGPRTGSSGSINVTLVSSGSQTDLLGSTSKDDLNMHASPTKLFINESEVTRKDEHPPVTNNAPRVVTTSARPGTVSAFNARRTIEQRRQHQAQQQQQHQMGRSPVPAEARGEPEASEAPQMTPTNARTVPSSTYLYGEFGSPTSSSISIRTMSISMSFDDLESNNSSSAGTGVERRAGGRRSEAWYERRQSYGFEAADKLQSLLNTSGSSDIPSGVSRSCDSLSSTVRSTSSQLEKMIPPWIKNPSPVSSTSLNKLVEGTSNGQVTALPESLPLPADETNKPMRPSSPLETGSSSQPPSTPTPSLLRSESSRSASQLLDGDTEPVWLRDLKVRRSLRETRRRPPPVNPEPAQSSEPAWLGVKLRPSGLKNLIDPDTSALASSPVKPSSYTPIFNSASSGSNKIQLPLLPNASQDSAMVDETKTQKRNSYVNEQKLHQAPEGQQAALPKTTIIKVQREEESETKRTEKLHHHRSIELMKMLEETESLSRTAQQHDTLETASTLDDIGSVYSIGTECSSNLPSAMNSNEDLTRKVKKVAFGKDVKEESDQKRSRPRRIRSRSPEARLRLWQEKLEEANKVIVIDPKSSTKDASAASKLAFTRFGDETPRPKSTESSSTQQQSSTTSDTFRALLHARTPYVIMHQQGKLIESNRSKYMAASIRSEDSVSVSHESTPSPPPSRKTSTIVNGIINFDSSVEQKITVLESETTQNLPPPKSILKKRSLENLLESELILRPPTPFDNKPNDTNNNSSSTAEQHQPRIKVIMTNHTSNRRPVSSIRLSSDMTSEMNPLEEQEVLPWRIHLKHVDPPLVRPRSPGPSDPIRPPWVPLMMERKKTPPSTTSRPRTPEDFLRQDLKSSSPSVPGVPTAVEIIRNIRQKTPPATMHVAAPEVKMVAHCQVKESTTYTVKSLEQESSIEPAKADFLGYHSPEGVGSMPEITKANNRRHPSIDETIAQLNETIEEIRCVQNVARVEATTRVQLPGVRRSASPEKDIRFSPKRDITPPLHQPRRMTPPSSQKASDSYPTSIVLNRTKDSSSENRISSVRSLLYEKEKSVSPARINQSASDGNQRLQETRTYYQSTSHVIHTGARASSSVVPAAGTSKPVASTTTNVRKSSLYESSTENRSSAAPETNITTSKVVSVTEFQADHNVRKVSGEARKNLQGENGNISSVLAEPPTVVAPRNDVNANVPEVEAGVEQLVQKFESTSTSTFTSESNKGCRTMETQSVVKAEVSRIGNREQARASKAQHSIELTKGMPEDKAALLVRKFFGNDLSVLEPAKRSRKAHPCAETITEESSNSEFSETSTRRRTMTDETENSQLPEDSTLPVDSSFDSDDLFRSASVATNDLLSCSSVGSALDLLVEDDRSIITTSSVATLTHRYSSCSERSVKLSDIMNFTRSKNLKSKIGAQGLLANESDPTSDNVSQSASVAASESASVIAGTEETRSTTSATSGSIVRRLSDSPHLHTSKSLKKVPARPTVKESPPIVKVPGVQRSSGASSTVSNQQRRLSTASKSSTDTVKTTSKQATPPIRPTRLSSTKTPGASPSSRAVPAVEKLPAAKAVRPTVQPERKTSSSSLLSSSRASRLVTITSYSSRGSSSVRPEEAVTGIRETPVAVGSGHYKIRMEQRIPFTVPTSKTSSTAARLQRTSVSSAATKPRPLKK